MQGVGAAVMFAVSLALLAHAFPDPRERGGALAAYGASIGASFAIGPLVGGALTSALGWRWIFLVNIPLCLLAAFLLIRSFRETTRGERTPLDLAGASVLAVGLAGAWLISRRLQRQTHGMGEAEITRMYEYYSAVLHAVRADLLRRLDRPEEARAAYDAALERTANTAEQADLRRRRAALPGTGVS